MCVCVCVCMRECVVYFVCACVRECVHVCVVHFEFHLALAVLYLFQENLKLAEHKLITVTDECDDNATVMLAELKFHSHDYFNVIAYYKYIPNPKRVDSYQIFKESFILSLSTLVLNSRD